MNAINFTVTVFLLFFQSPGRELASIEGTVMNAGSGDPLSNASVTLMPTGSAGLPLPTARVGILSAGTNLAPLPGWTPKTVTTDRSGHFAFTDLNPGAYTVSASRNGFVRLVYGQRSPNRLTNTPIELVAGQHVTELALRLTPAGTVTGRVYDSEGEPIANVDINLLKSAYDPDGTKTLRVQQTARTNDLGEYRLFWVTPGRYYVEGEFGQPGGGPRSMNPNEVGGLDSYMPTYYPGTTDASAASPIEVGAGSQISAIDLTILRAKTFSIRGRIIVDPAIAGPRTTLNIGLRRRTTNGGASTVGRPVAADGSFEFPNVMPGSYYVDASTFETPRPNVQPTGPLLRYESAVAVEVNGIDVDGLTIVIGPGIDVRGRITIEGTAPDAGLSNDPLRGLRPLLRSSDNLLPSPQPIAAINADGTFLLRQVQPGKYQVVVSGLPAEYFVKIARLGGSDALRDGAIIDRTTNSILDIVVSANGGRIEGVVTDKDGTPAAATLTLVPQNRDRGDLYKIAAADPSGKFRLRGIAPGEYKVFAWEDIEMGAQRDPDFMRKYEDGGSIVIITEGGAETVNLRVIPSN
jgi:protocatechuate 3,4-dioxygenase beta subunit